MSDDPVAMQVTAADPQLGDAVAFLKSPVFLSLLGTFFLHLAAAFGRHFDDTVITAFVQNITDCAIVVLLVYAMYKRWRSKTQPLKLTAKSAAVANLTQPGATNAKP